MPAHADVDACHFFAAWVVTYKDSPPITCMGPPTPIPPARMPLFGFES